MKARHTFGLLVLLGVLCLVYYGLQRYRTQQEEATRVARNVFAFAQEDLRLLTIDRIDGPACTAERDANGAWRILEPNPTISPFQMMWERVANHLAQIRNEHTVLAQPADLATYGLDAPALVVSGETKDHVSFILQFGDLEPTQRHRYARLNDGALFLVDADAFFELNRALTDLRHRFLVDDRESPLLEVEFAWIWTESAEEEETEGRPETGEESIVVRIVREGTDAPWRMVEPEEAPADHNAAQALADELQFAVVSAFIDDPEDLSDYGLNPPRARITVRDAAKNRRQTLWIGAPDAAPDQPGLFARREHEEAVVVMDPHLITLLPRGPFDWRDRRLLTRRVTDINRLDYATELDRFVMEKNETGYWRLIEPVMDHVNELAVSGFLSFFKEIAGEEFVEGLDSASAFADPAARIALRFDDNAEAEIMIAPHKDEPGVYLALQDSGGVVSLSEAAARMLLTDSENFRSREMLRFGRNEVEELTFSFEGTEYHLVRRHNLWTLRAPESMQLHNQADVNTLMSAVSPLFITGIAAIETPDDLSPFGLDAPVFDLVVMKGDDATPLSLKIGAPNPNNPSERFALSSMRKGIHRISQEVMDEIREALRGIH